MAFISAAGSTHYKGVVASSGMILTLKVGQNAVAKDDSFEGESSNIGFMASASHNFLLTKSTSITVEARLDPRGVGGQKNTDTKVNLSCFALQT